MFATMLGVIWLLGNYDKGVCLPGNYDKKEYVWLYARGNMVAR